MKQIVLKLKLLVGSYCINLFRNLSCERKEPGNNEINKVRIEIKKITEDSNCVNFKNE